MQVIQPSTSSYLYTITRTLDINNKKPYIVNILQEDDTIKTAFLSFNRRQDAVFFANTLQSYRERFDVYPGNTFNYIRPLEIIIPRDTDVNELYKEANSDLEINKILEMDLYINSAENMINLMIVDSLDVTTYSFRLINFDIPLKTQESYLENKIILD